MKPVTQAEILSIPEFRAARPQHEREVLSVKEPRRVALGPNLILLFENRVTVRWQVQEMCRVEGIERPDAIQHELDTYNALLPGPNELSATMLVAFEDPIERDRMLAALIGLERHLWLEIDGQRSLARFDAEQFNERRISSVQFVRFRLGQADADALCDLRKPATFVVDHPVYSARTALAGAARGALVADLLETGTAESA